MFELKEGLGLDEHPLCLSEVDEEAVGLLGSAQVGAEVLSQALGHRLLAFLGHGHVVEQLFSGVLLKLHHCLVDTPLDTTVLPHHPTVYPDSLHSYCRSSSLSISTYCIIRFSY